MPDGELLAGLARSGLTDLPPWRRGAGSGVTGMVAWSVRSSVEKPRPFARDLLAGVDREWAWGGADGAGVRVCIVDSGVEGGHPLVGALERSVTAVENDNGSIGIEDCEPEDMAGHGTACAGVIRSVAPGASLSSVRVLTDGRNGTGAALLAGLKWAIDEGFDVVNLSVATTQHRFAADLHALADRAYFRRTVLVASAHNRPIHSFPWTFSSVFSVASHDEPDPLTYYYNPAAPAEFHARGVRVPTAWPGGRTTRSSGNSFAAPHIAGLCALVLSKHPWLTPFQLKTVLYLCAHNVAEESSVAEESGGSHDAG